MQFLKTSKLAKRLCAMDRLKLARLLLFVAPNKPIWIENAPQLDAPQQAPVFANQSMCDLVGESRQEFIASQQSWLMQGKQMDSNTPQVNRMCAVLALGSRVPITLNMEADVKCPTVTGTGMSHTVSAVMCEVEVQALVDTHGDTLLFVCVVKHHTKLNRDVSPSLSDSASITTSTTHTSPASTTRSRSPSSPGRDECCVRFFHRPTLGHTVTPTSASHLDLLADLAVPAF
eukprot:c11622_g1_i1.p1 GENE.c11622_g1_i1~~c11622_g1_i1.p1  ORF type:complete len:231 (+),score=73.98 c11622_g1_i1:152-844(+)